MNKLTQQNSNKFNTISFMSFCNLIILCNNFLKLIRKIKKSLSIINFLSFIKNVTTF